MSYLFPAKSITFDAALRDLAAGSPKARALAAHALGDLSDEAERRRAIEALIAALEDDRMEVRAEACSSLGDLGAREGTLARRAADGRSGAVEAGEPALVAALGKRLADGSAAVRQNAAIALGTIRHPDGFAPLAEALADGPADLRFQAVTSLAEIDGPRAYDPTLAALGDSDPQVVGAAALALGGIGDARAVSSLAGKLDIGDAGARFDIAYALAELGDATGRAVLVGGLLDEDRAWDAVMALGWLAGPDDVSALARCMTARKTPIEASVLAAGTVLTLAPASTHEPAARALLLDALGNRKTHVRGIAVEQLGAAAGRWAIPPLDKLARSGRGDDLREAIATAIRAIESRLSPA